MKIVWMIAFALLLCTPDMYAQKKLTRQVLGSLGGSTVNATKGLHYTFGQPPNVGTVKGANKILRQGFQQPQKATKVPCANAAFTFTELGSVSSDCGTYYRFEYTGDAPTGTEIVWDFGADAVPKSSTSFLPDSVFYTKAGAKTVRMTVKTANCTDTRAQTLNASKAGFGVLLTLTDVKCGAGQGSAHIRPLGGTPPYTYKWSNNATDTLIKNLAGGKYGVTVADATGCKYTTFFRIGENTPIAFTAAVKDVSCGTEKDGAIKINLTSGVAPITIQWVGNEAKGDSIANLGIGEYKAIIVDGNGCKRDTTIKIEEYCKKIKDPLNRYNVFSPNNDNDNDVFIIPGIENYPDNDIQIFNRWGSIVYEQKSYINEWKGTNTAGKELPTGAYYYIVKLNDKSKTTINGSITIIR